MLSDLLPLIAALAAAAWLYGLREAWRRRNRVKPPMPEASVEAACALWREQPQAHPDHAFLPAGVDPGTPAGVEAPGSRIELRREILAAAASALHLDAIAAYGDRERQLLIGGYEPGMEPLLRGALEDATRRWAVLRLLAHLKYDDAVAEDWFHHFMLSAGPYIREKVRLARDHVLQLDPSAGRLVEVYDALIAGLVGELLEVRPKKRFVPPGL